MYIYIYIHICFLFFFFNVLFGKKLEETLMVALH